MAELLGIAGTVGLGLWKLIEGAAIFLFICVAATWKPTAIIMGVATFIFLCWLLGEMSHMAP